MWVVIATLTTVGYGDYAPKTMPGRFLGFILCIWGIVEISIIVVVLFELLVLNYSESQALYLFNKLEKNKKLKSMATESNSN
jgi:voltage-gated potassium channel